MPSSNPGFGPPVRTTVAALVTAGWLLCSQSRADVPPLLHLKTEGACPSEDTIQRQLRPLLPATEVVVRAGSSAPTAHVVDHGASFTINVNGAERNIGEPARDCVERARISAVFIALVLDPPLVLPKANEHFTSAHAPLPAPEPAERTEVDVSVAAAVLTSAALASPGPQVWSVGPTLGVALGHGSSEGALSMALLSPAKLEFDAATVRVTRAPIGVSYRLLQRAGDFGGYGGVGLELEVLHISGVGFERSRRSVRLGAGGRASLGVRHAFRAPWTGFAELAGAYFLRPYRLEVEPQRVLGTTPRFWLAVTLGAILHVD